MKKTTVTFSKTFTSGSLKGMTFTDSIPFVDRKQADKWIDGLKKAQKSLNCIFNVIAIE